jgi:hypothetical protein
MIVGQMLMHWLWTLGSTPAISTNFYNAGMV